MTTEGRPPVDIHASEPPPSTYDLSRGATPAGDEGGRSLMSQIWRTVFSLALVVALIYGLGKLAMWRLGRVRPRSGTRLKVTERLQLDARHALFVVELTDGRQLLLGVGHDKGVAMLANLAGPRAGDQGAFARVLAHQPSATAPPAQGMGDGEGSR